MAMRLDEYIEQGQRADVKDDQPVSKSMRLGDFMAQEKQVVENPELIPGLYQPTEEQTTAWKAKGEIGYWEQAIRMNKKRLIPFYFGDSVKTFKTWRAVNRLTADDYKADPEARGQDIQKVNDFLKLLAEENTRDFTVGGRITQGVGELPAFLTEFLATGGLANVGKQAVKESVKKGLRTIAKSGAKKFVTRVAGGVAKATVRTAAMPHRVLESGSQKALYAKLDFTDKGYNLLEEAREAPAISFLKGAGDVVIENFSEEAGFYLGKYANKLLPKRLTSGMAKLYKRFHPTDSVAKFMKNTRVWNGFLNEMGEERLGDFLRAVLKVEDFGAASPESMVDRIISSIPNGEELMIEAAVLAVPGGANMLASNAISKYRTLTGKKAELDAMPAELDKEMSDQEISTFVALQAEKPPEKAAVEAPEGAGEAIEPGVGVGADLTAEARKYKTAEEFVEGQVIVTDGWRHLDPDRYSNRSEFIRDFERLNKLPEVTTKEITKQVDAAFKIWGDRPSIDRVQEIPIEAVELVEEPLGYAMDTTADIKTPIEVVWSDGKYRLIDGRHRLAQAKFNKQKTISAIVVDYSQISQLTDIWNEAQPTQAGGVDVLSLIKGDVREGGDLKRGIDYYRELIEKLDVSEIQKIKDWTTTQSDWMQRFLGDEINAILREKAQPTKPPAVTPADRLARLEEREVERKGLQEELEEVAPITEILKGKVRRFKKGFLAEELEAFPKGFFVDKSTAMDVDEARELVNKELGFEIESSLELAQAIIAEQKRVGELTEQIEALRPEKITRKDITVMRQKIADIGRGLREGKRDALKEAKQMQAELIKILKMSDMEAKDKAKFIATIKNIQTEAQFLKALPGIDARIAKLLEAASVRSLKSKITKELKKTKVKKQAGKPVGKYTAEVQEILDLMRETALLSKGEAEAIIQQNIEASEGLMPEEEIRLKNELLTLMSGLDEKTPASLQTILNTIQSMKKTGKIARRLQRMERNEDIIKKKQLVIDQVTGGKGIKPGRETVGSRKTTKEKFHATMRSLGSKMVLSWRGLMDTLEFNAGVENKVLADEFDTLDQDNKYKELTEEFNNDLNDAMTEAYGIDKGQGIKGQISLPYKIGAKINDLQQKITLGKFKNADGKIVELVFARDELIKKWMELQDPTLTESFEKGNKFTPEIIKAINEKLTDKDKAFGRKQFEIYKKQWKKVNPIYRDLFGANLPFNEFYSPIARENFNLDISKGFGSFIHDATTRLAVTAGAFKTRIKNVLPIKTQSSIAVLERHLKETNYFIAWAKRMKVFESVLKDPNVRESINQEFTSSFLNSIDNSMNDLTTNGNKWARRLGPVEFFRKNFTLGKLMIKPAIFAKQLVSTLAYLEKINPVAFTSGVADFWLTGPLKNYKTLQKESVLIRTRGANMERDIKNATTTDAVKAFTVKQNFVTLLMLNVKSGDKLAIIMGSWAMRKQRLSEKVALPDIVREYENFSAETQQSSDISRLSEVQRGGSFEKLFTMFKSSQRQYLQKELQAVKSLFQKGGTSPANIKKVAKVIAIYHVLLPVAFQYLANFGGWSDEDRREYLRAGILGSLNGLFIFGDIVDSIIRKALKLRVFSNEVPISTIANDVMRAMGKIDWDDITSEDVVEALGEFIEAGDSVGIPVTSIKNIFIGVADIIDADIKAGIAEILGWSPRVVKKKKKSGETVIF